MNAEFLTDSASSRSFQKNVYRAWEAFMTTGHCNREFIRDFILSSWQRCNDLGTPHRLVRHMPIVADDVLRNARERSEEYRLAAQEVLNPLLSTFQTPRTVILVTDAEGIILDSYGTRRNIDFAADINLRSGGNCHESAGGTNAIGTALAIGRAAQVHAEEHFYEVVKGWTCAAALVRDPIDQNILGVLDISGTRDTFNSHNLALAISIAKQIEALLKHKEAQSRVRLLEWCHDQAAEWRSDALIVFDTKGRVVCRNKHVGGALDRLGLNASDITASAGASALPAWIKTEWVHPVIVGTDCLGSLVVIPAERNRPHRTAEHVKFDDAPRPAAFRRILGKSTSLRAAIAKAARLAQTDCSVLILGETGVGKEEFALAIHEASPVRDGPFVAINSGAFPKDLAASELFGYADGAFTGGRRGGRAGKFQEAHGGTLFLDEVGELAPEVQVHLLRVLQNGEVQRIGEHRARRVNVRIISATHVDLRAAVDQGRFRKDLYYRLCATSLTIAPLRERREDIPRLAQHFLHDFANRYKVRETRLSADLLQTLEALPWAGNVRELRNVLEQMCHLSAGDELQLADLPAEYSLGGTNILPLKSLGHTERQQIQQALAHRPCNLSHVARELGIARSTLYQKIKKYSLTIA